MEISIYPVALTEVDFRSVTSLSGTERICLRRLWEALASQREFTTWAKYQLQMFKEHEDFGSFDKVVKREIGASVRKEYWVTVDTAKHIALMARTAVGHRVRQYLIECEKLLRKQAVRPADPQLPAVIDSQFLLAVANRVKELESERDTALSTKAQISDRKTATALGTAGAAVRDRNKLISACTELHKKVETQGHEILTLRERLGSLECWFTADTAADRIPELARIPKGRLGYWLEHKRRRLGLYLQIDRSRQQPVYPLSVLEALANDFKRGIVADQHCRPEVLRS